MGRVSRIADVIASGINGYMKGTQIEEANQDRAKERAFRDDQQNMQRQEMADKVNEKRQLAAAAAPVTVEEGANGAIRPETMDNRDVGQAGEAPVAANGGLRVAGQVYADKDLANVAASVANSPDAVAQRQSAALSGLGKPLEAMQLRSASAQAKTAEFQLEKGQQEFLDKKWDQRIGAITKVEDLTGILSGSPMVGGAQVKSVPSADGKTVQLVKVAQDGSETAIGKAFSNDSRGVQEAIMAHSRDMPNSAKISALQHFEQFDFQKQQHADTLAQQDKQLAAQERWHSQSHDLQLKQLGISQATLALAQKKAAEDSKIDPATKLYVSNLSDQIKAKAKSIDDARAAGSFDPNSKTGQEITGELNALMRKQAEILTPYMEKGAARAGVKTAEKAPTFEAFAAKLPDGKNPAPGAAPAGAAPPESMPGSVVRTPTGWSPAQPVAATRSVSAAAQPQQAQPQAAPAADPLLQAMGADGSNTVSQVVAQRAPAIRAAADAVRTAQAQVVAAAKTGNQQAAAQAMAQAQTAGQQFQQMLAQMEPGMAQRITQAVGL